jgi:hypothetical protein
MYYFDRSKMDKLMVKANISQNDVARALSVTHRAVGRWGKNGCKMKMSHFELLTGVLDCAPNALYTKM